MGYPAEETARRPKLFDRSKVKSLPRSIEMGCFPDACSAFGPRNCGKTALIDLVPAPLFGSRKGDPMNFLKEGRFNKDLFGAALLVLDDTQARTAAGLSGTIRFSPDLFPSFVARSPRQTVFFPIYWIYLPSLQKNPSARVY